MNEDYNSYMGNETGGQGNSISSSGDPWNEEKRRERRYERSRRKTSRERNTMPRRRKEPILETPTSSNQLFATFVSNDSTNPTNTISGVPNIDPSQWPLTPAMSPYTMVGDPTLMGMMGMAGFGQFGFLQPPDLLDSPALIPNMMPTTNTTTTTVKEIIRTKNCTLYPPKPSTTGFLNTSFDNDECQVYPSSREKPPGCRTVFVGGLPENATEEIIWEIFAQCGEVSTIRMSLSKKNFCHIRYVDEIIVDNALYLSGYRVIIDGKDEILNTGRLHVDYAQARDDQYDYECSQRALQRELRHRERVEQERLRPPSPPPTVHYSEHEASILVEKLRGEETFPKAAQILITWLERGESSKKSAGHFYSMVQSTNSHVRRLMNEKAQHEEELNNARQLLRQRMQGILIQFNQIEKVFVACSHQKVWDHFTKPQRKTIDMWRKQAEEIKNAQLEEVLNEREEDEMELSDDDMPEDLHSSSKKSRTESSRSTNDLMQSYEVASLKEESDSLRCQLEAYRNEVEVLKVEGQQEKENQEKQVKILQQALQGMQQQLVGLTEQKLKDEEEISKLKELQVGGGRTDAADDGNSNVQEESGTNTSPPLLSEITSTSGSRIHVSEKEARLIGLIATFLHVHPFGAGVDYIWSFLHQLDVGLQPRDVEALMNNFPSVFRQELSGVGAMMERKWKFVGFIVP